MMQQTDQQNAQTADCQEHADPKHNVAERAVSPVVNTAPPQNMVLFLEHSYFKYDASRALKRIELFFNKVRDIQDKCTPRSDLQDANDVDIEKAECEDNIVNYWVYARANKVYTQHAPFTYILKWARHKGNLIFCQFNAEELNILQRHD
jgi:hypothetical protein